MKKVAGDVIARYASKSFSNALIISIAEKKQGGTAESFVPERMTPRFFYAIGNDYPIVSIIFLVENEKRRGE